MGRLFRLELLILARSRATRVATVVLLLATVVSVWHGWSLIGRQRQTIVESPTLEADERSRVLSPLPATASAGEQLYYLFFHTVREPSAWAPLVVGQRDVHAFNLKIRLHALQGQLYDVDLGNPLLASFGHFDFAFVLVFLLPLAIIAMTFDLRAGEGETGAWELIASQPVHAGIWLTRRALWSTALAWLTMMALLVLVTIWLPLPLDGTWWTVVAASLVYAAFWCAIVLVVAGLHRPASSNLLLLLGVWMTLTLLGPAAISVSATARFPLPDALELTIRQRQGFHGAWDEPLPAVMEDFYTHYPEWRGVPIPQDTYSNAWYYAMHQRGDDSAADAAHRYRQGLESRERFIARMAWWCPPAALHRLLASLARTDLASTLRYLDSVAAYHETLKHHFMPAIFWDRTIGEVDWNAVPRHTHRD